MEEPRECTITEPAPDVLLLLLRPVAVCEGAQAYALPARAAAELLSTFRRPVGLLLATVAVAGSCCWV